MKPNIEQAYRIAQERYAASFWANGANPGGIIKMQS